MNKNVNKISKIVLALALSTTMFVTACSVSQFEAVLNQIAPAISTILQIVAIFRGVPANMSIPSKVGADVAALEKLYNDYESTSAASKPGVQANIATAFTVLNQDLSTVFATAQVSDPNTQAKISALISLVQTGVSIAEAAIPAPVTPNPAAVAPKATSTLTASGLVTSYNQILVAKTGNAAVDNFTPKHKLHVHGGAARFFSFGIAK